MPRTHPYRSTKVSVVKTIEDIYGLFDKHVSPGSVTYRSPQFTRTGRGATGRTSSTEAMLVAEFEVHGLDRTARIRVAVPAQEQDDATTATNFEQHIRQQVRIRARALFYTVKSSLEAIQFEMARGLVVLFPYLLLPDGTTIEDKPDHDLELLLTSGTLMLPAAAGPDAHGADITRPDAAAATNAN